MQEITEQELFWQGEFGNQYISRNNSQDIINSNMVLFSQILRSAPQVTSIAEFGCNIGLNLKALNQINPKFQLSGFEINDHAVNIARQMGIAKIRHESLLSDLAISETFDLCFTKGVLIHINPDALHKAYKNIYDLSKRYIVICEYYNPSPVAIDYRGNADRLFKRDFAGDMIEKYDLHLIDYGFVYHRDNNFPQDDLTWFLLEK